MRPNTEIKAGPTPAAVPIAAQASRTEHRVEQPPQGPNSHAMLQPAERRELIAQAAYLRAEQRGFIGGHPVDDWLAAETEIDALLGKG